MDYHQIQTLLGKEADNLLAYKSTVVSKELLYAPSQDFVDKVFAFSNRNTQVLRSLSALYNHGRLAETGYLSILPIDQGIEHTAGSAFAANPNFSKSDPECIAVLHLIIQSTCAGIR